MLVTFKPEEEHVRSVGRKLHALQSYETVIARTAGTDAG